MVIGEIIDYRLPLHPGSDCVRVSHHGKLMLFFGGNTFAENNDVTGRQYSFTLLLGVNIYRSLHERLSLQLLKMPKRKHHAVSVTWNKWIGVDLIFDTFH
jgi:hypothetical protein